jgi:undecaprenyl-diphosphatase
MTISFYNIDAKISYFIYYHVQNPLLTKIMIPFTTIGNAGLIWIIIISISLLIKKYRRTGIMALAALILGSLLCEEILKPLIHRSRPFIVLENLKILIQKPTSYSFPSGHTTAAFSVAGSFIKNLSRKWSKIFILLLAFLVSFSRLYLLVHYFSDVLAGAILGLLSANIIKYLFNKFFTVYDNLKLP